MGKNGSSRTGLPFGKAGSGIPAYRSSTPTLRPRAQDRVGLRLEEQAGRQKNKQKIFSFYFYVWIPDLVGNDKKKTEMTK